MRTQFDSIIGLIVTEHSPSRMQQFAHDRYQRLQLSFAMIQQTLIKSSQPRIVLHRHQRRHIEGGAQVSIAGFADAGGFCAIEEPDS